MYVSFYTPFIFHFMHVCMTWPAPPTADCTNRSPRVLGSSYHLSLFPWACMAVRETNTVACQALECSTAFAGESWEFTSAAAIVSVFVAVSHPCSLLFFSAKQCPLCYCISVSKLKTHNVSHLNNYTHMLPILSTVPPQKPALTP